MWDAMRDAERLSEMQRTLRSISQEDMLRLNEETNRLLGRQRESAAPAASGKTAPAGRPPVERVLPTPREANVLPMPAAPAVPKSEVSP